jgi:large subunit ribosomal protein L3
MKSNSPRHGSMQFWPRKRAKSETARVRYWADVKEAKLIGFAGYKVGMAHAMVNDERPNSITKSKKVSWPITIIECPPLTAFSIKFYKNNNSISQVFTDNFNKHLSKSMKIPKKKVSINDIKEEDFDDLKLIVHTNPEKTTIGKKKPEIFEIAIGGNKQDKLKYAKEILGKDINITDVFKNGQVTDTHAITTGKGFQGAVKRFGVAIRSHRSEKTKRAPGSLGGWKGHAHFMYRVAHAGQMGYHQRTEYHKQILKIADNKDDINPKSGFKRYGIVKNNYVIFKGSITGPTKRLIRFNRCIRPNKIKEMEFDLEVIN